MQQQGRALLLDDAAPVLSAEGKRARRAIELRASVTRAPQRFPNYAPGAADPIFNVSDYVLYSKAMNPAVCGGASVLENCMLDHFKTIITMPGRKYGSS